MADPEPPQPTPFPIRIVQEKPSDDGPAEPEPSPPRTDDFYPAWDKFLSVQTKRAKKTSRSAKKLEEEKTKIEQGATDGLQIEENAAKSWEQAASECRAKVAAIVEECYRLNQKYRDAIFDLEASPYCLQGLTGRFPKAVEKIDTPPWIKRVEDIFDKPQFFIDGATANDVHQGSGGDCWFLAALMAVSAKRELMDNLCIARDEKVGVYGFVFYRDGEWIYEVIDDKLFLRVGDDDQIDVVRDWDKDKKEGMSLRHNGEKLKETLQRGGESLYFSHCKSNETWLPLIEKAYAKAHGDYSSIEGGFVSEGIEDLTGGVAVVINPEDIMDKERFWKDQLSQVNEKYLFGGGSKPSGSMGFVGGHAYTVLEAWEEGDLTLLKMRNPWGEVEWEGDWSDGSKLWTPDMMRKLNHQFGDDGVFWISYKDFLKHFPSINRVRLFDKEWQVAQHWTCVNVPWTVDYLDTKFEITLTKQGPLVVVLSQPDDRYFYGLRGRYLFSMHFRLYKEGEMGNKYLVRSMHNSGNETTFTRSVSAELEDLAPGRYFVIFKITALRTQQATAEEAVLKYAIERKEKLLSVGRRFDYAQTKGNLRAMEKANRQQKRDHGEERMIQSWKRERKLNKKAREKMRLRKKRIADAMNQQEKELRVREQEKRKQRRERNRKRRPASSQESRQANVSVVSEEKSSEETVAEKTPTTEDEAAQQVENVKEQVVGASTNLEVDATPADTQSSSSLLDENGPTKEELPTATDQVPKPVEPGEQTPKIEDVSKSLAELNMDSKPPISQGVPSPILEQNEPESDDDVSWGPPTPPIEPLEDDDFDWDSEIDNLVTTLNSSRRSSRGPPDIFEDDPWSASCVIGLRVYSKGEVKIRAIGEEEEDEEDADDDNNVPIE